MKRDPLQLPLGRAVCYSGYREGQSPDLRLYPSVDQIREDLRLLQPHFSLLRVYDCSPHAERVLQVIEEDGLPFRVLLGAYIGPEVSNPGCPWGGVYSEEQLASSRAENQAEVGRLIHLAQRHPHTVFAVAVGNEATVDWTDHLIPVPALVAHVKRVKQHLRQPVTFCENYVPWHDKLQPLVDELDFISVHSYPVWEQHTVAGALAYTQHNLHGVMQRHPNKPVVITEAGWTTRSNGRGIPPEHVSQQAQADYLAQLMHWTDDTGLLCFVFEAFDEPWKGSADPLEPEKHWGLYTVDRQPKQVMLHATDGIPAAPQAQDMHR